MELALAFVFLPCWLVVTQAKNWRNSPWILENQPLCKLSLWCALPTTWSRWSCGSAQTTCLHSISWNNSLVSCLVSLPTLTSNPTLWPGAAHHVRLMSKKTSASATANTALLTPKSQKWPAATFVAETFYWKTCAKGASWKLHNGIGMKRHGGTTCNTCTKIATTLSQKNVLN